MYITLSSKNEPSNSRFTNKFLDNITFPPNSKVSLVGATINQNAVGNKIVIPANTYIYLRTNDKNILRFQPNIVDTTYTKAELVDRMNTLIAINKPYGIGIQFLLVGNDIEIKFFAEDDFDYNVDFMDYVWGSNVRPQAYKNAYQTSAAANYPAYNNILATMGTTTDQEPIQFQEVVTVGLPEQYSYPVSAPKQLVRDTVNASRAFDRARVFDYHDDLENHIYDSIGVCWGPQNAVAPFEDPLNHWTINWGHATFDRTRDAYTKIPGPFQPADTSNYKEQLNLKGDYTTQLSIFNSQTNTIDNFTSTYLPGDVIQHYLTNTSDTPPAPNVTALYNPLWRRLGYNGLHYWLPCSLDHVADAADRQYNTLRLEHEEANNFLQNQADLPQLGANFITAMGFASSSQSACNRAIGVASGFGQNNVNTNLNNVTPQFISYVTGPIQRNTAETENYFNFLPKLTRRNPADGAGLEQTSQERIRLTQNQVKSLESTAWQIFCIPEDDSATNTGTVQYAITLLGGKHDDGTEAPVLYLYMNQSIATDIRIASKNSAQLDQQLTLLDGGGTRINPQWGDRFGILVTYTKGDTKLKATVWQIAADYSSATPYFAEATLASGTYEGLPDVTCIGGTASGQGAGSTAALRGMSGTIGHFRLYNFTGNTTQATLPQDATSVNFEDAIGAQWINTFMSTLVTCVPIKDNLFDSRDRKYAVIGSGGQPNNDDESETNNYCPLVWNNVGSLTANRLVNAEYPDLVDVFFIPNVNIKYADNFEGVSNLDISAYTGNGSGIVLTDSYSNFLQFPDEDNDNQRQIDPYTWYEPGDENPYENIRTQPGSGQNESQALRVCIDNLPHRTFNGTTGNVSKCIYEIQSDADKTILANTKTLSKTPSPRVEIPLNNAGELVLNSFDVVIRDQDEKEDANLVDHTSITIEIN